MSYDPTPVKNYADEKGYSIHFTHVPNLEIPNNDATAEQARRLAAIQEGTDTSTPSQTVVVPQDSQGNRT